MVASYIGWNRVYVGIGGMWIICAMHSMKFLRFKLVSLNFELVRDSSNEMWTQITF